MVNLILEISAPTVEVAEEYLKMAKLKFNGYVRDYMITDLKLQQLNEAD